MPAAVYNQAIRFKSDLANHEVAAMRTMATRWVGVMGQLQSEIDAVARTMVARRAAGLPVTAGYLYRTERYQQLLTQSVAQFKKYETYAADVIADNVDLFERLGVQHAASLLQTASPGVIGAMNRLPVAAVEKIAGATDAGPLQELLSDAWPDAIDQTTQALVDGVALGYGPERIAKMMNRGMATGLQRSFVIARTETMRAYRMTKQDVWLETGMVEGMQRVATHDRRTCPACLLRDGEFIAIDAPIPEHPQGRCTFVPVRDKSKLHDWKYGEQWFEEQPASTQIAILGPGRHKAWKDGQIKLGDIPAVKRNSTWGPSLRARGLKELMAGNINPMPPVIPLPPPAPVLTPEQIVRRDVLQHAADARQRLADRVKDVVYDTSEGRRVREQLMKAQTKSDEKVHQIWDKYHDIRTNARNEYFDAVTEYGHDDPRTIKLKDVYETATDRREKEVAAARAKIKEALYVKPKDRTWGTDYDLQFDQRWIHTVARGQQVPTDVLPHHVDGAEFVNKISNTGINGRVNVRYLPGRANAQYSRGLIELSVDDSAGVAAHEMGHMVEGALPRDLIKVQRFLHDRIGDDVPIQLLDLNPAYDPREVGFKDKFIDIYTGKVYGEFEFTEVISMGVQYLYRDPVAFAETDADFFDFIISYLRRKL